MATGSLGAHVDTISTDPSRTVPDGPIRGQFVPHVYGTNNTRREPYGEHERDSQGSLQAISRYVIDVPYTPSDAHTRLQVISLVDARDQLLPLQVTRAPLYAPTSTKEVPCSLDLHQRQIVTPAQSALVTTSKNVSLSQDSLEPSAERRRRYDAALAFFKQAAKNVQTRKSTFGLYQIPRPANRCVVDEKFAFIAR